MLDWYYQGIEKMEVLAIRQLVTGVVNLIGVMVLVHQPEDVIIALLINSAAAIINAIWMIMYYFKTVEKIKFSFDVPLWKKLIKPAIPITFSNFFVTLLNTFNILILGIYFTDASLAGQYNAAFKIMVFAILPTAIIQGAFFPVLSKTYGTDDFLKVAKKYSVLIFLAGAIISAGFYTFSEFIIITAFSAEYKMAIDIMKILMLTSFIVYLNTSLSPQLIAIKKEKSMMYAMGIGAVISVVLNIVLIPRYGAIGAAWVTVLSEFSLLIGLAIAYFAAIKKLFVFDIIKASVLAALSCYLGYHVAAFGIHEIIAGFISFFIFIALNLLTKTFSIAEVKGYFVK
jgi:O-antigen/teichoic acid export membrane protein